MVWLSAFSIVIKFILSDGAEVSALFLEVITLYKKIICACFVLTAYLQIGVSAFVAVAESDAESIVIDGVEQDPIEPIEPELIELEEDEYIAYIKACNQAVQDGEPIPDYIDYAEEQGTELKKNLTSWLFDDTVVYAYDDSLTPYVDFASGSYDALVNTTTKGIGKLGDWFSTFIGVLSKGTNKQATSVVIPKYYNFRGKTIIQYPSKLREQVILTVSTASDGYSWGCGSAYFIRIFNGVVTTMDIPTINKYSSSAYRYSCYWFDEYTQTLNANVDALTTAGYVNDNGGLWFDYGGRFEHFGWFFAGSSTFSAGLNTTTYDSLTNQQVIKLVDNDSRTSGYPVYVLNSLDTNDVSVYQKMINNKVEYNQWNYPITYNNTFVAGDTITTENVSNYADYGLTVNNLGYLDFDPDLFIDHLADIEAQLKLTYEKTYEQLPEEGATAESYEGTYYYPYATESPSSPAGMYTIDVDVNIDWATYDPLSTQYVGVPVDNSVLRAMPENIIQDGANWMQLFTYFWDRSGYLPFVLGVIGLLLVTYIVGR